MAEYLGMSLGLGTNATKMNDQLSLNYKTISQRNDMQNIRVVDGKL